jgi:hypothetical protein
MGWVWTLQRREKALASVGNGMLCSRSCIPYRSHYTAWAVVARKGKLWVCKNSTVYLLWHKTILHKDNLVRYSPVFVSSIYIHIDINNSCSCLLFLGGHVTEFTFAIARSRTAVNLIDRSALRHVWHREQQTFVTAVYDGRSANKFTWRNFVTNERALIRRRINVICFQLKQSLGGHKFEDDRHAETVVTRWLITQDTEFCQQVVEKLVPRCNTCLICGRDCAEK